MDDPPVSFPTLNSPTVTAAMLTAYSGSTSSSADGPSDNDTPVFVGALISSLLILLARLVSLVMLTLHLDLALRTQVMRALFTMSLLELSSESRERLFNETVDEIFQQIRNELASALLSCLHRYGDELLDISGPSSSGFKRSSSSPLFDTSLSFITS
ncbi:hypothetical protein H0H92_011686 [Tricholoma furcatifolium]|nr:hypothetical protein H0H92_011686 [Tricholoma furcatifolium]